ncbi:hypothetical protein HDU67_010100 [Dinochytrium kinnereticum]|nr:hypothetical protein HDU67_010100 [Dinochytrium kinnereticum]
MSRRQSIRFLSDSIDEEEHTYTPRRPLPLNNKRISLSHDPNTITEEEDEDISPMPRYHQTTYNPTPQPDQDNDSNSSDSDEYDESMFQKYQQILDQDGGGIAKSVRGSAMGQGGAMSRRSTAGTWTLRGGGNHQRSSGDTTGMDRRASRITTATTTTGNRRASFVANMSLVPIALRRLKSLEGEGGAESAGRMNAATFASAVGLGGGGGGSGGGGVGGEGEEDEFDEVTMALKRTEAIADRRKSAITQMKAEAKAMVFNRKRIFLELSFIFGVSMLAVVLLEYIYMLILEQIPITTYWLFSLLIIHTWGIYLFILAFVYANEAEDRQKVALALFSGAINVTAFALKCTLVFMYWDLVPDNREDNFF